MGYKPNYNNTCYYCAQSEPNMYAIEYTYCTHPDRKTLDGSYVNFIRWLFREKYIPCAAAPYYECYCPFYKNWRWPPHEKE